MKNHYFKIAVHIYLSGIILENLEPIDELEDFLKHASKTYNLVLYTKENLLFAVKWIEKHNFGRYFIGVSNKINADSITIKKIC